MSRKDIRVSAEAKAMAKETKRDGETWDEWVRRVAQLERATRVD
jgi:hypothetical protein